ncbi:low-density lipoprotein receptor-related protein 2-like isoform X2 [Crassostrea angulata]|uniref:low-density lipoprotein receptor-related protein 2-like isoform X2 n=1 Tax=Magallana angulata TaxID=2784310 RepID=UPI0022B21BF5|nr:low-density lipoprotein receptor-related protein 2-like isoform X2 [Crassostrea angulata]
MTCILFYGNFVYLVGVPTVVLSLRVVSSDYANVALNKPTHQESPAVVWDARFESSNAVDGLKSNHTWDEGQCVVSAYGKQTATWWVNLSSIHSIHHINIYFRTGNEKLGFDQPLRVTVSPGYLRLKEGQPAVFRCQSSVPVPLRWSTSSNKSLPVQASVGDNYLEIPETRISDSGSYKCFAVGEESRFFAVARLDIYSECEADKMMCSNTKCVPISFICDGDNDCGDFSDERNCTGNTCRPDQMTCSNGKCVPISYICDGDNDCGDLSDERNCASTCGPDQMTCSNGKCVPISYICDGDNDCGDLSDERNCETISYMPSNFLGFSVYVSNTTYRSQGTLCFKDNNFTTSSLPAVFTINCSVHGQYVIYYNERLPGTAYPDDYSMYAFNDVCEVEVYESLKEDSVNNWQTMFYCMLGVFCVSLIINGLLVQCVHSRGKRLKKQRTNDEAQWRNGELLNVSQNCNDYENFQQTPVEIYDTVV